MSVKTVVCVCVCLCVSGARGHWLILHYPSIISYNHSCFRLRPSLFSHKETMKNLLSQTRATPGSAFCRDHLLHSQRSL